MQAEKVFKENFRVHYKLNVNGDNVYIDLRSVGMMSIMTKIGK